MNEVDTQPDTGSQEVESSSVATKLGLLDERGLSDLIKSSFLDEQGAAPATEEQQDEPQEASNDAEEGESDQPESEGNHLNKGVQKRINKLVGAKKALEAELDAHRAELLNLRKELDTTKQVASRQKPEISNVIQSLETTQAVESEFKNAVDVILWCEENLDGGTIVMPDGKEVDVSSSEVRSMKRTAIRRKEIELPARYKFLNDQATVDAEIIKDFPWMLKPESEEYRVAQQVLNEFPELRNKRADWKHVAGIIVEGLKAYTNRKATKPGQAIKRAPAQPSARSVPSSTGSSVSSAKQAFAKNNSDKAGLTDLVKAMGFA
jgi:hypothetical protein